MHPLVGGMALPRCRDGSAQPHDRGLVDAADTGTRHRDRRAVDGGVETEAAGASDRSLGAMLTVRKR